MNLCSPVLPEAGPRPIWVRFCLFGHGTRDFAMASLRFWLACAALSAIIGIWYAPALLGLLSLVAALSFWLAIRWVDKHCVWKNDRPTRHDCRAESRPA
jgi:hypothetical protein